VPRASWVYEVGSGLWNACREADREERVRMRD